MIESALDRLARVLGEHYDGSADPIDTPNNFARARGGIVAVLTAMRDPTPDMRDAGWKAFPSMRESDLEDNDALDRLFGAMIDRLMEATKP